MSNCKSWQWMRVQKESVEKSNGLSWRPGEEEEKVIKETEKEWLEDDLVSIVPGKPGEQRTLRRKEWSMGPNVQRDTGNTPTPSIQEPSVQLWTESRCHKLGIVKWRQGNKQSAHRSNFQEVWMRWGRERSAGTRTRERSFRTGATQGDTLEQMAICAWVPTQTIANSAMAPSVAVPPFLSHFSFLLFYHIHIWQTLWALCPGPSQVGSLAKKHGIWQS